MRPMSPRSRWTVIASTGLVLFAIGAGLVVAFPGSGWRTALVEFGGQLNAVAGDEGLLVAVGCCTDSSVAIWTSEDGAVWSFVSEGHSGPAQELLTVARWPGGWLAGGRRLQEDWVVSDDGKEQTWVERHTAVLWTSPDGTTWEQLPHTETFTNAVIADIVVHEDKLVAVGGIHVSDTRVKIGVDEVYAMEPIWNAAVWLSDDGRSWERIPHNENFSDQSISTIITGGPGLVAGGSAIWVSADGIDWEIVDRLSGVADLAVGGPGLVAVGSKDLVDGAIWTSPDGRTWTPVRQDLGAGKLFAVAAHPLGLVAAGSVVGFGALRVDGVIWTSQDGFTWSRTDFDETHFHGVSVVADAVLVVGGTSQSVHVPSSNRAVVMRQNVGNGQ